MSETKAPYAGKPTPAAGQKLYEKATAANQAVQRARVTLRTHNEASALAHGIDTVTGLSPDRLLLEAQEAMQEIAHGLVRLRLADTPPRPGQDAPEFDPYDLSRLPTRTMAMEALHHALTLALPFAEEVDAEAGNSLPASVPVEKGESRGHDFAEAVAGMIRRLERQLDAPRGRGE